MNKDRRKEIDAIISELESLNERITTVLDDEREFYDNMPESFQGGSKGDAAQEAISELEQADLESIIEHLQTAKGE